jgi:hypothetical protein
MAFNFAKAKDLVRRTVHKTFGVQAFYQDSSLSKPVEISARWHSKIEQFGDLDNQSYAEIVQGIDRVIFEAAEVRKIPIVRGGVVTFPEFGAGLGVGLGSPLGGESIGPPAFVLAVREPSDGSFREAWTVTRKESK